MPVTTIMFSIPRGKPHVVAFF